MRVLILGGTHEARRLATKLALDARYEPLLSYAGRTENPELPGDVACRVGGFGGAEALGVFLARFDALIDATHPFAAQISANAVVAARAADVPLLRLVRPAWPREDTWVEVASMRAAAQALGDAPKRVFLTIGRLEVGAFKHAPQHHYVVRAVDAFEPDLPDAKVIAARGPFRLDDERALLERERIDVLVSKNAGTPATYDKLRAARERKLPVIMVARPVLPDAPEVATVEEAEAWLRHGSERGE
ncbi:MAG TPA: cobalt-precorrin-6A reductase [Polyangiales bacterium]|nr:cobalt-precorrin-6A reductase [Polyangiales bacterium]